MSTATGKTFITTALMYLLLSSQPTFAQKASTDEQAISSQIIANL